MGCKQGSPDQMLHFVVFDLGLFIPLFRIIRVSYQSDTKSVITSIDHKGFLVHWKVFASTCDCCASVRVMELSNFNTCLLLVNGQVNGQNPLVQPRYSCPRKLTFSLFLEENIHYRYSLEALL